MSKKYKKLAKMLAPKGYKYLWKNVPLDTSELSTVVGTPVNLSKLKEELGSSLDDSRLYLNRRLNGEYGNSDPRDVRAVSYKSGDEWWKTFVPTNGRTQELYRYLDRYDQTDKKHIIEEATTWNEDYEHKRVINSAQRQQKFAEVSGFFRSKMLGRPVKVKKLFTKAKTMITGEIED